MHVFLVKMTEAPAEESAVFLIGDWWDPNEQHN
jgi:hypothetical protein